MQQCTQHGALQVHMLQGGHGQHGLQQSVMAEDVTQHDTCTEHVLSMCWQCAGSQL